MDALRYAVGRAARNRAEDVAAVQAALQVASAITLDDRLHPGDVDGWCGDGTEGAIEHLQRRFGSTNPDALIEPGKTTWRRLDALLDIGQMELTFPFVKSSRWPFIGSGAGMRAWGASRSGGKRAHAGIDIYHPRGTSILAIGDGEVIRPEYRYYAGTNAIDVRHGRLTVVYGEIEPKSARHLSWGAKVHAGQIIAEVGHLQGIRVPSNMLHIEGYDGTGTGALGAAQAVHGYTGRPFRRRVDLIDLGGLLKRAPLP